MRQHESELERLGVRVLVLTFEARERAQAYVRETGLRWPLLIDRERALYSAYGMGRGRWWGIWGPASLWAYLKLIGRGQRPQRPTGDIHQLGGDILVNPMGMVALDHVGKGPADRPTVTALFERIRGNQP